MGDLTVVKSRSDAGAGVIGRAVRGGFDLAISVFGDPQERGRQLFEAGEFKRAIACLARSDSTDAVALLSTIIERNRTDPGLALSAVSAIATIAGRSPDARIDAIHRLVLETCSSGVFSNEIAKKLADVMRVTEDLNVHSNVSLEVRRSLVHVARDESRQVGKARELMARFFIVAAALRDPESAAIIAESIAESTTNHLPHTLAAAAEARMAGDNRVARAWERMIGHAHGVNDARSEGAPTVPQGRLLLVRSPD